MAPLLKGFLICLFAVGVCADDWWDYGSTESPSPDEVPTTAAKPVADVSYCGCALDKKFGMPDGWDSTQIWIDVVIILDTSEAMGDMALVDASSLIESFIGTEDGDVLITDTKANFYSRVGLIAMSDKPEIIYNLNMTKYDKVQGKAQIKKGLTQINVVDAFTAALNMFADGLNTQPDRSYTRQVIYYMTNSDPKTDLSPMNQFKTSQGIIIVNNFVESGVVERPGLKNLASDGYYYNDIQFNYMATIQLFCKANCYCRPDQDRTPYNSNPSDPAVKASGGCLRAVPSGVPFSKARSNCDSLGGGLITSTHDSDKAAFANQLIAKAAPNSDYYWIGYSKNDAGKWVWEDQSSNTYTNWDVANGEPSSASVAKCTYVDKTTAKLLWGAGNCNVGFPFLCEFAPCEAGNKNWMKRIFSLFLLFLLTGCIHATVYSCNEVKNQLINNNYIFSQRFICLFLEEGYTGTDSLSNIYAQTDKISVSFTDLVNASCAELPNDKGKWRIVADSNWNLPCTEELTLIFTSSPAEFNLATNKTGTSALHGEEQVFVSPRTGFWFHGLYCYGSDGMPTDEGNITVYTGAGTGESENRYLLKSWKCNDFPDTIMSFDNVITIIRDPGLQLNMFFIVHDPYLAETIRPGFHGVVMGSGRSDNLAPFYPERNRGVFYNSIHFNTTVQVTSSFDVRSDGYVKVEFQDNCASNGWNKQYRDESATSGGVTNWLTVYYVTNNPQFIYDSLDNFIVEFRATPAPVCPPPTTTSPTTTTTRSSETSGNGDKYCNCPLDKKFGLPDGWDSTQIWVDVIIILDTSEAMGDNALVDASYLIESFIGTDDGDVLITDTKANFYTRVGLIAMSDKPEVLYNLNMTKSDRVLGKAQIKKGLTQINVVDAFTAALNMFADGLKTQPDRGYTRQVIYYMTNSDPKTDLSPINQFKTSQGIVIVNNFIESGAVEKPGLKDLASDGYYYNDIQYNYWATIQLFCKANCFCRPDLDRTPYPGSNPDPAVKASGGCLRAVPSGVPFSKARSNCDSLGGGLITSIHDSNKAAFANQLMSKVAPSSDYYWIGYSKNDAGKWAWEDQSANSYTNWDTANGEPSTASVAKCAYVDSTTPSLFWGAGNCNVGFPFLCEFAPCEAGNNNC